MPGSPGTPLAAGAPPVFPICMAHLLARDVLLGWGLGGQLQLRIPEGGFAGVRGAADGLTGTDLYVNAWPVPAPGDGPRRGASERGPGGCPGDEPAPSSGPGSTPSSTAAGRAPGG